MLDTVCDAVIWVLLRLAVAVDDWRRTVRRRARRLRGSVRRLLRVFLLVRRGTPPVFRRHRAWNRTPRDVEEGVVRLHVEHATLGAGQLRHLVRRVLGAELAVATVGRILQRNQQLVVELEAERQRRRRRRIEVNATRLLWGADITLLWGLGVFPVWVLGVVDYHGSRLVALESLTWPSASAVIRVMHRAFRSHGAPKRVLTDRGAVFRSAAFEAMLAERGVAHTLTKPCHPWTNGRIERVFRTLKQTIRGCFWLLRSGRQVERVCQDFLLFYNAHRPHSAYEGRTPDEVHAGRAACAGHFGRLVLFEGRFHWWRFS
jgi:transposase InsO family protein